MVVQKKYKSKHWRLKHISSGFGYTYGTLFLHALSISGKNGTIQQGRLLAPFTTSATSSLSALEKGGKSLPSYPEYHIWKGWNMRQIKSLTWKLTNWRQTKACNPTAMLQKGWGGWGLTQELCTDCRACRPAGLFSHYKVNKGRSLLLLMQCQHLWGSCNSAFAPEIDLESQIIWRCENSIGF